MMTIQAIAGAGSGYMPIAKKSLSSCGLRGRSEVGSMVWAARFLRLPSVSGATPCCTSVLQGTSHQDDTRAEKLHSRIGRRHESQILRVALRDQAEASFATPTSSADLFVLDLASKLEDSIAGDDLKYEALSRFEVLKQANLNPVDATTDTVDFDLSPLKFSVAEENRIIIVDGVFSKSLLKLESLAEGLVVGSLSTLPKEIVDKYVVPKLSGVAAKSQGDLFACLNGIGARDLGIIIVPEGVKGPDSLQIAYISTEGAPVQGEGDVPTFSLSNPRLLVIVEKEGELNLVEDFVGAVDALYWKNSVCEIMISERGQVTHNYCPGRESKLCFHSAHIRFSG